MDNLFSPLSKENVFINPITVNDFSYVAFEINCLNMHVIVFQLWVNIMEMVAQF